VPFSDTALENPLDAVPTLDDAPAVVEYSDDRTVIVRLLGVGVGGLVQR
jgi:hypothetical protein